MQKREAIRDCKRLWKEIVESGLQKREFFDTDAGIQWEEDNGYDCPLCAYVGSHKDPLCDVHCPLVLQYGKGCTELRFYSDPAGFYEYVKGLK